MEAPARGNALRGSRSQHGNLAITGARSIGRRLGPRCRWTGRQPWRVVSAAKIMSEFRCGHVALVGVPNVGKSTLLNHLLGEELAIVSPSPQTTRDRVVGVRTVAGAQLIFVDSPGMIEGRGADNRGLGRHMAREALAVFDEVDVVVVVTDATARSTPPSPAESRLLSSVRTRPCVVALNKIDQLRDKRLLLPLIERWSKAFPWVQLLPISARQGDGVPELLDLLRSLLPVGPAVFPQDTLTDRSERFLVQERIREQVFLCTRQEIPYATAVTVDRWQERTNKGDVVVEATIHVEKDSQRAIVVGKAGAKIGEIGTRARASASQLLGRPIHLKLWVSVSPDWRQDEQALAQFGYAGTGEKGA